MARKAKFSFSGQNLKIDEIAGFFRLRTEALRQYYNIDSPSCETIFLGYTRKELESELKQNLVEIELDCSLNILAALEAMLRVDYIIRCEKKLKDVASLHFRKIYSKKGVRISLERDILDIRANFDRSEGELIREIKGAFRYRHWLAHGRYWELQAGRSYDFNYLYELASLSITRLSLYLKA